MLIEWLNADTTCSQESLYSLHQLLIAKVNIKIRGMMEGQMIRLQYLMDIKKRIGIKSPKPLEH